MYYREITRMEILERIQRQAARRGITLSVGKLNEIANWQLKDREGDICARYARDTWPITEMALWRIEGHDLSVELMRNLIKQRTMFY